MLVLTRHPGEDILIGKEEDIAAGKEIVVTVFQTVGKMVRIGIEAPKDVVILRREVYERMQKENNDD